MKGIVYTETVVHSAPERWIRDAPYQIAIIVLEDGTRVTGRILGDRARIDEEVELAETRDGVRYFRRSRPAST